MVVGAPDASTVGDAEVVGTGTTAGEGDMRSSQPQLVAVPPPGGIGTGEVAAHDDEPSSTTAAADTSARTQRRGTVDAGHVTPT